MQICIQVKIIKYCKNSLQALVSQSRNLPVTIIYRQQIVIIIQLLDQPSSISCRTMLHLRIKHRTNFELYSSWDLLSSTQATCVLFRHRLRYRVSKISLIFSTLSDYRNSCILLFFCFLGCMEFLALFASLVTLPLASVSLDYAASLALPALSSDAESLAFC